MTIFDPHSLLVEFDKFIAGVPAVLRRLALVSDLADKIEMVKKSVELPFTMAVVGQMRIGKSTLINALVGDDIAITGVTETTATVNWFRHGTDRQSQKFRVVWNDLPTTMEEFDRTEITRWVGDSALARKTRYLEFFSSAEFLKGVQVVDTPGSRSVLAEHENTLRGFLSDDSRVDQDTMYFGGSADCIIYVLPAVARENDRDLLESFSATTRLPSTSAFNSVAVLHKWEALIEHEQPWLDAKRKSVIQRTQLQSQVADVVPVSGPLHRAAKRLDIEFWNRVLTFAKGTPSTLLSKLISGMESRFKTLPDNQCPLTPEARAQLLRDSQLTWPSFKIVIKLAREDRIQDGVSLRAEIEQVAGVNALLDFLRVRFFDRARAIRAITLLRKVLAPCDEAIRRLRLRREELGLRNLKAQASLRELAGFGGNVDRTRKFIEHAGNEFQHEHVTIDRILRELELTSSAIREQFRRFEQDLNAIQLVDENPTLFSNQEKTEILTILGAHGHSLESRLTHCGGSDASTTDIERRLDYWLERNHVDNEACYRQILSQVVARLQESLTQMAIKSCS